MATTEGIGSSTRIEDAKLSDREVEALIAGLETGRIEVSRIDFPGKINN